MSGDKSLTPTPDRIVLQAEIAANFDYLMRNLAIVLPNHAGQYALLKGRRILGYFDDAFDADVEGTKVALDGIYSIQKVTDQPVELGVYLHAVG